MQSKQHADKLQEVDLSQLRSLGAIKAPMGKTTKREGAGYTLEIRVGNGNNPAANIVVTPKPGWKLPHNVVRQSVKTKKEGAATWKKRRTLSEKGKVRLDYLDKGDQIVQFE